MSKPEQLIMTPEQREAAKIDRMARIDDFIEKNKENGRYLRLVPTRYRYLFYKIFSGENSKSNAIKAKCIDCSNFQKEEVVNCAATQCPLWRFRPFQK